MAWAAQEPGDARSTDRSLRVSGCFPQLLFVLSRILPFQHAPFPSRKVLQALCHAHSLSRVVSPWPHHCAIMSYTKLRSDLRVGLTPRNQLQVPDRNKSAFQWRMQVSQMLQGSLREARTDHRVNISVSWFCGRLVSSLAFASN